jgi:DNA-binding CsgD family transcriptional regulator
VSKSERLRLADVRAVFHLVGECRDLGDDPTQWRRHMAAGLCRLTGAQLAFGGEARIIEPDGLMAAVHFGDHGWPNAATRSCYLAWLKDPRVLDSPPLRRFCLLPGERLTRTRQQLIDDRTFYASAFFNEMMRPYDMGHGLLSRHAPPGRDWRHVLVFNRLLGDRPFGRRERRLVHLFQQEIAPLLGLALATSEEAGPAPLSPRQRQTLGALLEGDSEKQAARRLGLSVNTVHEYVTSLYRHFDVSSRAELLAHFLRRARGNPPLS